MPYLYIKISTGYVGAEHEEWVPLPDDYDTLTEEEQSKLRLEWEQDVLGNHVETNSWVVDEDGDVPREAED